MIRPITKEDREIFLALAKQFYASPAVVHTVPDSYHERAFAEMIRSDQYLLGYLLEADGQPVGYALLNKTFAHEAGGMVLWIEELFVLDAYRSRGLGQEFFTYLDQHLDSNVTRIRLEVEPANTRAAALYQKLGYQFLDYRQMVKELR